MKSKIEMMLEFLPQEQRDEIERGIRAMVEASPQFRMRDKIMLYRLERGLTQVDFARLANVDRGFIYRLEAGEVAEMGCTIDELLDDQTREELLAKPTVPKPRKRSAKNGTEK